MKWNESFQSETEPPASSEEILEFTKTVFAPLTRDEVRELEVEHKRSVGGGHWDPPFDPSTWVLPSHPLPESYLSFLRYSNGGFFAGENRDFDPLFSTREVRDYLLGYSIPHWMSGVCPIGFDGGGTFYLLDMREPPVEDDYPVLFAGSGALSFDDAEVVGASFAILVESALGQN